MYLSPINMSDFYLQLKPRLESAEALKLDLGKILEEHHLVNRGRNESGDLQRSLKKLKYSRVQYALQIYEKECRIPGIKEIDMVIAKVAQSNEKLREVSKILEEVKEMAEVTPLEERVLKYLDTIKEKFENARILLNESDLDMERAELEVRRDLFEAELKFLLFAQETSAVKSSPEDKVKRPYYRRIELDEFRQYYLQEYNSVKDTLKDDFLHAQFLELKNLTNDFVRKMKKVETKEEL